MTRNSAILIALLTASALVQAICIRQAVVPALDAVANVECAKAIRHDGLLAVLRERDHAPLFPLLLCGTHHVLASCHAFLGTVPVDIWACSVQVAACLPLILALVPVYLTLNILFGTRPAVCASAVFCVLPSIARLGADGLADSTHLFLVICALWAAVMSMRASSARDQVAWPWLAGSGLAIGLALFCRLEALVLLPAIAGVLLVRRQGFARIGQPAALIAGVATCVLPFVLLTGKVTPKHSLDFLARAERAPTKPRAARGRLTNRLELANPAERLVLSAKETGVTSRQFGLLPALRMVSRELPEAFGYLAGLLVVVGLVFQPRSALRDYDWLAIAVATLFPVLAIGYASRAGYMSDRHLLLLVVVSLGWAGAAIVQISHRLTQWRSGSNSPCLASRSWRVAGVLTALTVLFCAPRTFRPLHATRTPHLAAARWLAAESAPDEKVLDTMCLTSLYSGRDTYSYHAARRALLDPKLSYIVVEEKELDYATPRARTLRRLLAERGQLVSRFTHNDRHAVLVYRWQSVAAPPQRTLTRKNTDA